MSILNILGFGTAATEFRGLARKSSFGRALHTGRTTFNAGRNAEKRKARAQQATSRRRAMVEYAAGYKKFRPAKTNSSLVVKMLSNRRLRQLDARRYGC